MQRKQQWRTRRGPCLVGGGIEAAPKLSQPASKSRSFSSPSLVACFMHRIWSRSLTHADVNQKLRAIGARNAFIGHGCQRCTFFRTLISLGEPIWYLGMIVLRRSALCGIRTANSRCRQDAPYASDICATCSQYTLTRQCEHEEKDR